MSKALKRNPQKTNRGGNISQGDFVQYLIQRNVYLSRLDSASRCTFCSPPLIDLLGSAPETAQELARLLTADTAVQEGLLNNLERMRRGETPGDFPIELARPSRTGKTQAYAVTAFPSDHEEQQGLIIVIDNISNEKTLKREVEHMGRLATVGQITAGVAHELNNILTSVLGWTQIGHQNAGNASTVTSSLEIIEGNARRARTIAGRLLSISKDSGEKHRPILVADIVREVLRLLTWEMKSAGIQVVRFLDAQDRILGDENSISQVFINIIRNAMDAMPDGGTLQVSVLKKDDQVEVAFSDTGPGIDEELLGQIFNPFFSTKQVSDTSTHGGTGLGLAICKDIINQHGGQIQATSKPSRGTRFTILFPITQASTEEASAEEKTTPAERPQLHDSARTGPQRVSFPPGAAVLVADDEPDVGEMVRMALELKGATVFVAQSGAEAVELCKKHDFDAAFVDYSMPGLSGHNLGREMLSIRPNLQLIFMSGREVDVVQDIPVADFLKKPFDLDDIQIKLRTVLTGDINSPEEHGVD